MLYQQSYKKLFTLFLLHSYGSNATKLSRKVCNLYLLLPERSMQYTDTVSHFFITSNPSKNAEYLRVLRPFAKLLMWENLLTKHFFRRNYQPSTQNSFVTTQQKCQSKSKNNRQTQKQRHIYRL